MQEGKTDTPKEELLRENNKLAIDQLINISASKTNDLYRNLIKPQIILNQCYEKLAGKETNGANMA